jgi:hypothetical protein
MAIAKLAAVVGQLNFVCWQILKGWITLNQIIFVKNKKKYERDGQLKVKIHILFYGDNS